MSTSGPEDVEFKTANSARVNPEIRCIVFASKGPGTDVFYTYACSGTTLGSPER